jgi:hypothetical protein
MALMAAHGAIEPMPDCAIFADTLSRRGSEGILGRRCTSDYKIAPILAKVRELIGLKRRQRNPKQVMVEQWIGISLDEAIRAKPSFVPFIRHRHPLLEKRMNRVDCLRWLDANGYPRPPKSSCIGCPYHSDEQWRQLAAPEFAEAVAFDAAIREGIAGTRDQLYLHAARVPLDQVDLSTASERGQLDLFLNECEGMCGV